MAIFKIKRGDKNDQKKDIISGSAFSFSSCISAMAVDNRATNSKTVKTSGGSAGYALITFRCSCVQETISKNYSWTSSISKPANVDGLSYYQKGAITKQNQMQERFSVYKPVYSKLFVGDALVGGYAEMSAGSAYYGSVKVTLSVTR